MVNDANYGYWLFFMDVGRSVCSDVKVAFLISSFVLRLEKIPMIQNCGYHDD
jgi:hypothetical protein